MSPKSQEDRHEAKSHLMLRLFKENQFNSIYLYSAFRNGHISRNPDIGLILFLMSKSEVMDSKWKGMRKKLRNQTRNGTSSSSGWHRQERISSFNIEFWNPQSSLKWTRNDISAKTTQGPLRTIWLMWAETNDLVQRFIHIKWASCS